MTRGDADNALRRRTSMRERVWPGMPSGGERFGPYRLLKKVGDGGFAEVFLAEPREGGDPVVVKRLHAHLEHHDESVEMFLTEARVMAELSHPNIVQIQHFDQIDGRWSIIMDRVDGPDLANVFDMAQELGVAVPLVSAIRLIAAAAEALEYAHAAKSQESGKSLAIIHRDVKPDNILVDWHGNVKVIDFGCARTTVQSQLTRPGIRKGTLDYMSPEQCLGRTMDHRTDVFSLGVVLYELVTMTRLYADGSDARVMERIAHEVTRPPSFANSQVNGPLDLIVLRALEKRPDDRFATMAEMARALRWWLSRYGVAEPADVIAKWLAATLRDAEPAFRETDAPSAHGGLALRTPSDAANARPGSVPPTDVAQEEPLDAARLAALRNIIARRSNLAASADALIGRTDELQAIARGLGGGRHVVALHGPSGVGKSFIADAYARARMGGRGGLYGGVWWVDASDIERVADLPHAVADVLELPGGEAAELVREVADALNVRGPTLIVIDAIDAIVGKVGPLLDHWLTAAPELELLVTANEPLVSEAVITLEVAGFPLPTDPRIVAQTAAGQLLVAGIRRTHPEFHLTAGLAGPAVDLLRELNGNPGAIGISAARLATHDPAKALVALTARGTAPIVSGHLDQDTLASAVEWSWEQLDAEEQRCLGAATVFHGGFSDAAAATVLGPLADDGDAVAVMARLCERSLMQAWEAPERLGIRRFKVIRAIGPFARARLVEGPHGRSVGRAHATYYIGLTETLAAACHGPQGPDAVQHMRLEMPNIHAVLQRAMRVRPVTRSSATRALTVAVHLWGYADVRGRYPDYVDLLGRTLDATRKVELPLLLRVRALLRMCRAALECNDTLRARQAVELAQRLATEVDDPAVLGRIALASGELCIARRHFDAAREFLQIAIGQLSDAGADREVAHAYLCLGRSTLADARLETAQSCMLTAREKFREAGALHGEASALADLGSLSARLEQVGDASERLRRAGAIFYAFGDRRRHASVLLSLAALSRSEGDFDAARRCCREAMELARQHGDEALQSTAAEQLRSLDGELGSQPMTRRDSWVIAATD